MMRLRAVPSAVWTAVGALAFLASTGLVLVLSAGLHVWSGPATRIIDAAGHALRGVGSGVVTVPGAARLSHPTHPGTSTPTPPTAGAPGTVAGPGRATVVPAAPGSPQSPAVGPRQPSHEVAGRLSSQPSRLRGGLPNFFRDLSQLSLTVDRTIVATDTDSGRPVHARALAPVHGKVAHADRHAQGRDGDRHHGGRDHHGRPGDAGRDGHRHDARHHHGHGAAHRHGHGHGHAGRRHGRR